MLQTLQHVIYDARIEILKKEKKYPLWLLYFPQNVHGSFQLRKKSIYACCITKQYLRWLINAVLVETVEFRTLLFFWKNPVSM